MSVPLDSERYLYLCFFNSSSCYLYDFVSRGVVSSPGLFEKRSWLTHFFYSSKLPVTHRTMCALELSDAEQQPWRIERHAHGMLARNSYETRVATEDDIKLLPPRQSAQPEDFREFVQQFLPKMKVIQGDAAVELPQAGVEEQTEIRYEIDMENTSENDELPWDIVDQAGPEGLDLDTPGGYVLIGKIQEAERSLALIRRVLQGAIPKTDWADVKIYRSGPNDEDEVLVVGLVPDETASKM